MDEAALYEQVRGTADELMELVGAAFLGATGWRNQMRAGAYAMLGFIEENQERARLLFLESHDSSQRVRDVRDEIWGAVTAMIDLGRQELDDPESVPPVVAEITAGAIYSRIHAAIEAGEFEAGRKMVPELMCSAILPYCGTAVALEELRLPPP